MSSFDNSMEQIPGENWEKFMSYMRGERDEVPSIRVTRNGASMDTPYTPNLKYRLAHEINEHVVREASMTDYHLGRHERDDIAVDYTYHLIDQNAVDDHTVAFEGLFLWRQMFGRGLDGGGSDGR